MSIRYTRHECQTNRTTNELTGKSSSRNEARIDSLEGQTVDRTGVGVSEVEPTEVGHKTSAPSVSDVSVKKLKIYRAKGHSSSPIFLPSVDYLPSSTRIDAGRSRTAGKNACSSSSQQPDNANLESSTDTHSTMADSQRTMFTPNMPQIPKPVQSEQLTQRLDRAASTQFPSTSAASPTKSLDFSPSVLPNSSTVPTDSSNTSELALHKQAASKHATGLRVKGQAEMEMQRNASQATYPHRVNRNDPQKNSGDTRDNQSNEQFYAESSLTGMDNANSGSRRRQKKGDNVGTETSDKNASYFQQRLPAFKHRVSNGSQTCGGGVSSSYTESGSEESLPSCSSESDVSPSADISRSSKRRKRVKRKTSNKSIGSSMYGEDNTSDGESVTETQSEFSDSCSRNLIETCSRKTSVNNYGRERTQTQPGGLQLCSSSITMLRTRKIMSTSLTSVSSLEGTTSANARKSSVGSRCTSPGGGTVAKVSKTQIQSFSATLPRPKKSKENISRVGRSDDENGGGRNTPEKSLSSDELSQINQLSRTSPTDKGHLSKSPFSLKYKPFQLQKTKIKSPFSSDHEQSRTQSPTGSDRSSRECISPVTLQRSLDVVSPTSDIGDMFDRGTASETPPPPSEIILSSIPTSRETMPFSGDLQQFASGASSSSDLPSDSRKTSFLSRTEVGPGCCATDGAADDDFINTDSMELSTDSVTSITGLVANRNRPLSIVSEQEEYAESITQLDKVKDSNRSIQQHEKSSTTVPSSTPVTRTSVEQKDTAETEIPNISTLRRPSYVFAQRISEERLVPDLLRHTDQEHVANHTVVSPSFSKLNWESTSIFGISQTDKNEEELTINSDGEVTAPLASQEESFPPDNSGEQNEEEKNPVKLSRPQIPSILNFDEDDELTDFNKSRAIEHKDMQVRESTHEGQESGDDVFTESIGKMEDGKSCNQ